MDNCKPRQSLPKISKLKQTQDVLNKLKLNTVCKSAACPNQHLCFAKKQATFLALGNLCSRSCAFCNTGHLNINNAPKPDPTEPKRIALATQELKLSHVVITMVTRDDLLDGGASHIASIIKEVKKLNPFATIEVLTSDFAGNIEALKSVLKENPLVFNHNLETVKRLTPQIRDKASYSRSLMILKQAFGLFTFCIIKINRNYLSLLV